MLCWISSCCFAYMYKLGWWMWIRIRNPVRSDREHQHWEIMQIYSSNWIHLVRKYGWAHIFNFSYRNFIMVQCSVRIRFMRCICAFVRRTFSSGLVWFHWRHDDTQPLPKNRSELGCRYRNCVRNVWIELKGKTHMCVSSKCVEAERLTASISVHF